MKQLTACFHQQPLMRAEHVYHISPNNRYNIITSPWLACSLSRFNQLIRWRHQMVCSRSRDAVMTSADDGLCHKNVWMTSSVPVHYLSTGGSGWEEWLRACNWFNSGRLTPVKPLSWPPRPIIMGPPWEPMCGSGEDVGQYSPPGTMSWCMYCGSPGGSWPVRENDQKIRPNLVLDDEWLHMHLLSRPLHHCEKLSILHTSSNSRPDFTNSIGHIC